MGPSSHVNRRILQSAQGKGIKEAVVCRIHVDADVYVDLDVDIGVDAYVAVDVHVVADVDVYVL